jgi:hypothetical protein
MSQGGDDNQNVPPVIRIAPLGELRAYTVYEHELDQLAQGSAGSAFLNFELSLLSIFATLLVTLLTVTIPPQGYLYPSFFSACLVTGIAAAILLLLAWKYYQSSSGLIERVKNRMPPAPGIQEPIGPIDSP